MLIRPPSGGLPGIAFDPVSFGVELVVGIISSLFGLFKVNNGIEQLRREAQQYREENAKISDIIKRFAWKTSFGLGSIITAVDHLWSGSIKGLLGHIKDLFTKLKDLALRGLLNAAKALHRLRQWIDEHYDKYVRPVLKVIETTRKILAILRAFNIKWADKLDGILGRIQGKIIAPVLYAIRNINKLSNWINVIVTAGGHFQAPLYLRSALRYQGYMQRIMLNSFVKPGGASVPTAPPELRPLGGMAAEFEFKNIINGFGNSYGQFIARGESNFKSSIGV